MSLVDSVAKSLLPELLPYIVRVLASYIPDLRVFLLEMAKDTETRIDDAIANGLCDTLEDIAKELEKRAEEEA